LVMSTAMTSHILVIDLGTGDEQPRVLRRFDHHRQKSNSVRNRAVKIRKNDDDVDMGDPDDEESDEDMSPSHANVLRLAISSDGQWLASADDHCRTHIFNLDSIQHHCVLPSFRQPPQALCFDPAIPSVLVMVFPDNTLQIYDVEARQFPAWSREVCNNLPKRFTQAHDPVLGLTFDPALTERPLDGSPQTSRCALFWGSTWLCKLNIDIPNVSSGKKRRRDIQRSSSTHPDLDDQSKEFKMITHYRPILCAEFLAPGELVVVERPLIDVLATLPPAYFRHKYGAS